MTKYPKTVWVGFDGELFPWNVWKSKPVKMPLGVTGKRYHLHPGNEVARALNVLSRAHKGILPYRYCAAVALHKAGFPVRWDAKKGGFV